MMPENPSAQETSAPKPISTPQSQGSKKMEKQQQQQQQQKAPRASQQQGGADGVQKGQQQQGRPQQGGNTDKTAAAGAGGGSGGGGQSGSKSQAPISKQPVSKTPSSGAPRLALFDHLPRKHPLSDPYSVEGDPSLHPAIIKLGQLYRKGLVYSDDDRVVALLVAFMKVIGDYKTPPNKTLSWDLDKHIRTQVQHLVNSRQHSMGMGNVIKYIRYEISHINPEFSEAGAKAHLNSKLQSFLEERIVYARESIVKFMSTTIKDDDVILTFGSSPLLRQVLLRIAAVKRFRLIVVDSRPLNEGMETLKVLSPHVPCVYTPLAGAASVMREVTRVVLGASSLLSNGSMLAPAGTAMVASLAKARRVPVIVVSESYKFCEKVQLDSIVFNEVGAAGEIACTKAALVGPQESASNSDIFPGCGALMDPLREQSVDEVGLEPTPRVGGGYHGAADKPVEGGKGFEGGLPFQVVNLRYDLTPIGNISVIATETGLIPPTSIPVLIRELRTDGSSNAAGRDVDHS